MTLQSGWRGKRERDVASDLARMKGAKRGAAADVAWLHSLSGAAFLSLARKQLDVLGEAKRAAAAREAFEVAIWYKSVLDDAAAGLDNLRHLEAEKEAAVAVQQYNEAAAVKRLIDGARDRQRHAARHENSAAPAGRAGAGGRHHLRPRRARRRPCGAAAGRGGPPPPRGWRRRAARRRAPPGSRRAPPGTAGARDPAAAAAAAKAPPPPEPEARARSRAHRLRVPCARTARRRALRRPRRRSLLLFGRDDARGRLCGSR